MENQPLSKSSEISVDWTAWLNTSLKSELDLLGSEPADIKTLAASTLRLSNHYVSNPTEKSPWSEIWALQALLAYYHPLNLSRAHAVGLRGEKRQFFSGFTELVDIGCGSGAASLGLRPFARFERILLYDSDSRIAARAAHLHRTLSSVQPSAGAEVQSAKLDLHTDSPPTFSANQLLVLSYFLTEFKDERTTASLIRRLTAGQLGGLVIIEPSTAEDARSLQRLRSTLLEAGFHIWAPCTHSADCPLLLHSEKDWCHDRIVPFKPNWWDALEAKLPIKNQTVTFSYLLARRELPLTVPNLTRVTGDTLVEKGKNRQLICRSSAREFLSWFPQRLAKSLSNFQFDRGDLFQMTDDDIGEQRGAENSIELRIRAETLERLKKQLKR